MPSTVPQPLGSNLPLASSLPKVSFRRIPEPEAHLLLLPAGVNDQQNVNYGFNDGSTFEKPEHYMRFVEPIEADLKKQVEYDMDEQDKEWLDALNAERRRYQLDSVSYEAFEVIVDRLEKEWFDLMRRVPPKPQPAAIGPDGEPLTGNEDTQCAICDDGECENSNAIVFCDGCNLAVHQDCYGIPYIPEGQWLCRKCTVSPDRAVACILCPSEGGAFKQTTQGKWAHLLCGLWIPETSVSNQVYMEPIDSVEKIPKARWKLQCYLCRSRHGACIQCDNKTCFTAFHVTCARKSGLLIKAQRQRGTHDHDNSDSEDEGEPLRAMCHKHLPKHLRLAAHGMVGKLPADDDDTSTRASTPGVPAKKPSFRKITIRRGPNGTISAMPATSATMTKSARAYKKSYRAGPPLVPSYIIDRVSAYVKKISLRKKDQLVIQVAKFWSLKREARRGAPLLKRLHLEPWTAAVTSTREQTEEDRIRKLQFMLLLREDLERLRMLAELARKREQQKLRQMTLIRTSLVEGILFPAHADLRAALDNIVAFDRTGLFVNPVSRSEVPDYYDVVKQPMDWSKISAKVDAHQYTSVDEFAADVDLVSSNAILYNKAETSFHRTALKIKKSAEPILSKLKGVDQLHYSEALSAGDVEAGAISNAQELRLEPFYHLLECLQEYDEQRRMRSIGEGEDLTLAPANLVEDLIRQYHKEERPPPHVETPEEAAKRIVREEAAAQKEEHRLKMNLAAAEYRKRKKMEKEAAATERAALGGNDAEMSDRRRSSRSSLAHASGSVSAANSPVSLKRTRSARLAGEGTSVSSAGRSRRSAPNHDSVGGTEHTQEDLTVKGLNDHDTFIRFEAGWILPEGTHRARKSVMLDPYRKALLAESSSAVKAKPSSRSSRPREESPSSSELSDEDEEDESRAVSSLRGKDRRKGVWGVETSKRGTGGGSKSSLSSSYKDSGPNLSGEQLASGTPRGKTSAAHSKLKSPATSGRARSQLATTTTSTGDLPECDDAGKVVVGDAQASGKRRGRASEGSGLDSHPPGKKRRKDDAGHLAPGTSTSTAQDATGTHPPSDDDQAATATATATLTSNPFPPLTLVWAKLMSYPYYPAAIMDETDQAIPAAVTREGNRLRSLLLLKPSSSSSPSSSKTLQDDKTNPIHLVRFFDESSSFGWIKRSNLRLLFEDPIVDEAFLEGAGVGAGVGAGRARARGKARGRGRKSSGGNGTGSGSGSGNGKMKAEILRAFLEARSSLEG